MPFLAVCPHCHYSQVCVLPKDCFPRVKCCRCRKVYDPVGSEDTEIDIELAGVTTAERTLARRPIRAKAARARRRKRGAGRRGGRPSQQPVLVALSLEAVAAAWLSTPEPRPAAPEPSAADTAGHTGGFSTVPSAEPATSTPARVARGPRGKSRQAAPAAAPLTAGALCLLGCSLVGAPIGAVGFLVRPFAAVSFLVGLWAIRAAIREQVTARYAVLVTALAATVTVAAFLSPHLIGLGRTETPDWAAADVQVVPHAQFAGDLSVWKAEWVDASKADLQQGVIRVRVSEVRGGRGPASPDQRLHVRLRIYRAGGLDAPPADAARSRTGEPRAVLFDAAGNLYEHLSAELDVTDQAHPGRAGTGKRFAHHSAGVKAPEADAQEAESSRDVVRELLLQFPMPVSAGSLRLEVPGALCGGRGLFKFAIPTAMVNW